MIARILNQVALLGLLALVAASVVGALATTNTVPETGASTDASGISANDLKPDGCASLNLNNVVSGSGTISDGAANSLISGSSADDTITGGAGDDCILGGGGDDYLEGGEGTDHCYGGGGADTFDASCEVQEQ